MWTREDDLQHDFYHTVSAERIEAGLDNSGKVVAWRHRSVAPTIALHLQGRRRPRGPVRTRHGVGRPSVRHRQPALRESGKCQAHDPHRLVPLGLQHPARLRGAVDGRRIARRTGRDPKDMLLELIGEPPHRRSAQVGRSADFWNYGEPFESYPIDAGRLRGVAELAADKGRVGPARCRRATVSASPRIAASSAMSRPSSKSSVGRQGRAERRPRRHRDRLRLPRQPGAHPLADRGRGGHGAGLAKHGEITFKDGRVEQSNFDGFPGGAHR